MKVNNRYETPICDYKENLRLETSLKKNWVLFTESYFITTYDIIENIRNTIALTISRHSGIYFLFGALRFIISLTLLISIWSVAG